MDDRYLLVRGEDNDDVGAPAADAVPAAPTLTAAAPHSSRVTRLAWIGIFVVVGLAAVTTIGILASNRSNGSNSAPETTSRPTFSAVHPALAAAKASFSPGSEPSLTRAQLYHHSVSDAGHTHLEYDVEFDPLRVVPLELLASAMAVQCTAGAVTVQFSTSAAAAAAAATWPAGTILTLRREWGCLAEGTSSSAVLRRIVATPAVLRNAVVLDTTPATLADVYKNAHIVYWSNYTAVAPGGGRAARGLWDDVKHFTSSIVHHAIAIAHTVVKVVSGDMNYNGDLFSSQFNMAKEIPLHIAVENGQLTGKLAFTGHVSVTTHLIVDITSFHIHNIEATITGDVSASLTASLQASASFSWSSPDYTVLPHFTLIDAFIPVGGIPVPIEVHVQAEASCQLTAQANAHVQAGVLGTGALSAGIQYQPSSGLQGQHSAGMHFASTGPTASAGVAVEAALTLVPELALTIGFIGGPQALLPLTGAVRVAAGTSVQTPCRTSQASVGFLYGVQVQLSAGLDVDVLGVTLLQKNMPPATVYSTNGLVDTKEVICVTV